jgi:putative transposase
MLPREYGSSSTSHRRFGEWYTLDVFKKTWVRLLIIYDNIIGINWTWQSIDSISVKSPFRGAMTRNNPTDRSKLDTKRHILTDTDGIPLSAVISSASTHDIKLVTVVVDSAVIKRPSSSKTRSRRKGRRRRRLQHLCLDKAYASTTQEEQELIKRGYVLHISPKRKRGDEEVQITTQPCLNRKKHSARRWIVYRKDKLMA